jgi:hypothetical protein
VTQSILDSTKIALGIPPEHTPFDAMIMLHINSVLADLTQLGVGPVAGFEIQTKDQVWSDFLGVNKPELNQVKSYMYLRVKLLFDPPEIGFVLNAIKEQIDKMEWKINVLVDNEILRDPPVTVVEEV